MNKVRIIRIPILPMHIVNAHLVVGTDGCILIDAGIPGSEHKIERVLAREKLTFQDIKLIVVTHAHMDHAGSAAILRERSGAPILAHEDDAHHYNRKVPMTFCPTGLVGRLFFKTGVILQPYIGFEPDILLSKQQAINLAQFGVPGTVRHTPGHTAGSISVELTTNEVLVGDLLASGILIGGIIRKSHAIRPPFEDDPHTVAQELQRLIGSGHQKFYMGHGGPLEATEVQRHVQSLMKLPMKIPV